MSHPYTSWTRRDFLKLAGHAGLLSAFPTLASASAALEPDMACISILHTTDLHGHILPTSDYDGTANLGGLARCVTQIHRWRRQNPNSILIDVGDVYEGTDVSLRNKGGLMIDLFNHLNYDAWVIGNHEFDWGIEPFHDALQKSAMPVLAANLLFEGTSAGEFQDGKHPMANVQPMIVKEILGIKVAIIGITTPGMSFWLPREFTPGLEFPHPVEPVRRAIAKAKRDGADAILLTGHMGLKPHTGGDDFANTVMALTSEFPDIAVFIAGHTHQAIPNRLTSEIEKLIGAAIMESLSERHIVVDGVIHGVFDENAKLAAGPITVNDIWNILPYENFIVTAMLSPDEIKAVMEEVYASHEPRSLLGIELKVEGRGPERRVVSMTLPDGRPLERGKKYIIAVNSFDGRSGGHHFMKLRALLGRPEANCVLHPVQTRDALINYFRRHKIVNRISEAHTWPEAA